MEFLRARGFHITPKKILFSILVLIVLVVLFVQIYSPIFINNFEDLSVQGEMNRAGAIGNIYEKDGDKMYYHDSQTQSDTVLLFIHGFGGSIFTWRNNAEYFYNSYRVIAPDLLGFGLSKDTKSSDIGIDRDVDMLTALIKDKNLKNIIVVGHSMGGAVAQKLALRNPVEVKSLILINSIEISDLPKQRNFLSPVIDFPLIKNPVGYWTYALGIESIVKKAYYNEKNVAKLTIEGYQKGFRYKNSLDNLIKFIKSPDPKNEDVAQISQPILIVSSENDEVVSPASSKNLAKQISSSKLLSIPASDHLIMEETPTVINEIIVRWIKEINSLKNVA